MSAPWDAGSMADPIKCTTPWADHPKADPVLAQCQPGEYVGVELECPRAGCDWTSLGTAEVVNALGVRECLPRCCGVHRATGVRVRRVVEAIR
jgi:hypothetical protein